MTTFFAQHVTLRKFTASLVLLGMTIWNVSSALLVLAPVAHAQYGEPDVAVFLTGAEMVDNVYPQEEAFSNVVSVQHPHPTAIFKWTVVFSRNVAPYQYNLYTCKFYGNMVPRDLPPLTSDYNTGTLMVNDPIPGAYFLNCGGISSAAEINVYGPYDGPLVPWCPTGFGTGTETTGIYDFRFYQYFWLPLKSPLQNDNVSFLGDGTEECRVFGGLRDWSVNLRQDPIPPWSGDNKIGWPAIMSHTERETTVHYKNAETVSVCTKITTTATNYRVGLQGYLEVSSPGEGGDTYYMMHRPFGISHEATIHDTQEHCVDHPLDDKITSATVPTCVGEKTLGLVTTTYTRTCDTNAIADSGPVGRCHSEKSVSQFGGILGLVVSALTFLFGNIISVIITFAITALQAAEFDKQVEKLYESSYFAFGSMSAPVKDLGTCTWSEGLAAQAPVGDPTCAENSCSFNPKSIIVGGKTIYSWDVSPAVTRAEFSCTGDLGKGSADLSKGEAPYKGSVDFYPKETQTCTLKLFNSAGTSRSYRDTISLLPPPLSADIKAAPPGGTASDGPITIPYNTAATISWSSVNAASCTVAPAGFGGISNSGISTGNLTASQRYDLTCSEPNKNVMTVTSATYAASCGAPTAIKSVATQCNGKQSCTYQMNYGVDPGFDPVVGCPKDLKVNYTCPVEGAKSIYVPPEAGSAVVHLSCPATQSDQASDNVTVNVNPPQEEPRAQSSQSRSSSTGTISLRGMLNGSPWPPSGTDSSIHVNYVLPDGSHDSNIPITIPADVPNLPLGNYTLTYVSGGPEHAGTPTVTPSSSQTLAANATTTFTFNFFASSPSLPSTPPQITSITPPSGPQGTSMVIRGSGFTTTTRNQVNFVGPVSVGNPGVQSVDGQTLIAFAPSNTNMPPGIYNVTVVNANGTSNSDKTFTVTTGSPPPTGDSASCVVTSKPASIAPNTAFTATVQVTNTGGSTWTHPGGATLAIGDYFLAGAAADSQWDSKWNPSGQATIMPVSSMGPGAVQNFTVNATSPSTTGTQSFNFQMQKYGQVWLPTMCASDITVTTPPQPGTTRLHATLDHQPLSATVTADFEVPSLGSYPNSAVAMPADIPDVPPVTITTTYRSISAPYASATFVNITRADGSVCADGGNPITCTQTLPPGGDITFTYNFASAVSALLTPSPSLAALFSPFTASLLQQIEAALANIQINLSLLRDLFPRR